MSTVLYQKYRSQDFDELIGQEHITKILKNAVKSDQISHAYLFVGSRGTGKTSTARILSKAVNCLKPKKDGNPCGKCEICKSLQQGRFLDLVEIDAASNRGIDQIRELKEKIEFSPTEGKYKVYIIDEVHMLTNEAFNALLKTLEEPPAHVIFILATTDVHKLPATILSRCQRYDFRLGSDKEIESLIKDIVKKEGYEFEQEALQILVSSASGSYRDALSLVDVVISGQMKSEDPQLVTTIEVQQILGIPDSTMISELLTTLLSGDQKSAFSLIKEMESKGVNLQQFTASVLEVLREILIQKITGDFDETKYAYAKDLSQREIIKLISVFLSTSNNLKNSKNQSLLLEMLIVEIPDILDIEITEPKKKKTKKKEDIKEERSEEVEEQEEEEEEDSDTSKGEAKIEIDILKEGWSKYIDSLKGCNAHLFAIIGSSKLVGLEGNKVKIEVPFKFHKDRIEDPLSREVLMNKMRDVFGFGCPIICDINEKVKPKFKTTANVILRKIQKPQKKEEEKEEKRKITNVDIDAIFEGV